QPPVRFPSRKPSVTSRRGPLVRLCRGKMLVQTSGSSRNEGKRYGAEPWTGEACRVTELLDRSTTVPVAADVPLKTAAPTTRLSFRAKTIYGSGALVEAVITAVLSSFHLFFLTAVCGMPGTLAGLSTFIGLAVDAFVDPLIGSLSDNSHSRWGR